MVPAPDSFDDRQHETRKGSFLRFFIAIKSILALVPLSFIVGGCDYDAKSYNSPRQANVEYIGVLCEPRDPLDQIQYEQGERMRTRSVTPLGDSLIAVSTWDEDVFFVDVTDPGKPTIVSVFRTPGFSPGNMVAINGNMYLSESSGLVVADIREPTRPKLIGLLDDKGEVLAAEGDRLYVTDRRGPKGVPRGVQIWDTTNPSSLTLAGVYIPPQYRVGENYLVFKRRGIPTDDQLAAETAVYSDAAKTSMTPKLSCNPGISFDADIKNELLYASVSGALCTRDGAIRNLKVGLALKGGLWIVDVKNPNEPKAVGFLPLEGDAWDVKVQGDYAYLATAFPGFQIVDISDPTNPILVGVHDAPSVAGVVEVEDNIAYIGDIRSLHIFDVTDPVQPIRIGLMSGFFAIDDIASRNGIIYLAGIYHGPVDEAGTCQSTESISTYGVHFLRVIDLEARPFE